MTTDKLLNEAMLMLAARPSVIFLGQNVLYPGNIMYNHLEGVPIDQRIEFPVAEELQTGVALGLSLQGFLPVSIYPRADFLCRAMDQLCLHLDKLSVMTCGRFHPKVIIRTKVGSKRPLDAGPQHTNDISEALKLLMPHTAVVKITDPEQILPVYRAAMESTDSTVVVEALG